MARVSSALAPTVALVIATAIAPWAVVAQAPSPAAPAKTVPEPKQKPEPKAKKKAAPEAKDETANKPADPADVQKRIDAAQKSLDAGKFDLSINQINAVMSLKGLESRAIARALAVRGQAYRRQGKPAQAIADLQSALHLKGGLNETERAAALQARTEAYREAGLPEPQAVGAPSTNVRTGSLNKQPDAPRTPVAAAPSSPPAPVPPAPSSGNFFSNLFGGNNPKPAPNPQPVAPRPPAAANAPPAAPATPQAPTKVAATPPARAVVAQTPPVPAVPPTVPKPAAAPTAPAAKGIRLQLGAVRSQQDAQALADRVRKDHAAALGDRRVDINQVVYGNMGTFYIVRFGPYGEQTEPAALCTALKAKGVDCQVVPN